MFVVQRLVHSTIKRLLGQFVKNNIDSIEDGNGLINLSNLNFREDVLNKYLQPFGFCVTSATLGHVWVDIASTTVIHWSNIRVLASSLSPQTIPVPRNNDLGDSLFTFDDDDEHDEHDEEEESGMFSSFLAPIQGLQKKIEGMALSIQHRFTNVEVIWDGLGVNITGRYSENEGVVIESAAIFRLADNVTFGTIRNCSLQGQKISCEDVQIELTISILIWLMTLKKPTTNDSSDPLLKTITFKTIGVSIPGVEQCAFNDLIYDLSGKRLSFEQFECRYGNIYKTRIDFPSVTTTSTTATTSMSRPSTTPTTATTSMSRPIESCSPFDEDKIFLFHSQPKPTPIANVAKTSSFVAHERNTAKGNIVIRIAGITVTTLPSITEQAIILNFVEHFRKPRSADNGYCIDVAIQRFEIIGIPNIPNVSIIQASCLFGQTAMWSAKTAEINIENTLELRQLRIAGEQMKRMSGDIRELNILNLPNLIVLIRSLSFNNESTEPFDFIIRVRHVSINANQYFDEKIVGETIEIFSSTVVPNAIIITSGRVESMGISKIRISSCQVSVADSIEVSVASIHGVINPQFIGQLINLLDTKKPQTIDEQVFLLDDKRIIRDYASCPRNNYVEVLLADQCSPKKPNFKIIIRQARIILQTNRPTSGHLEFLLDQFKVRVFDDNLNVSTEKVECLDRLTSDVWNKALILHKFNVQLDKTNGVFGDFQVNIGTGKSDEDVTISLDQHVIDFFTIFAAECGNRLNDNDNSIRSFHIAPFKARIDYKPSETSQSFMRFLPLRGAVVKVKLFDSFDTTPEKLAVQFALHTLNHVRNLPRILSGIKPFRAPLSIFRNVAELILIPLIDDEQDEQHQYLGRIVSQAQTIAGKMAISILELGPALNVRRVGTTTDVPTSLHSNQPNGIKNGLIQAGQTFATDMGTVIAFVSGDIRNIDLFDLPLLVVRPLTAPLTDIVNGICNQVDPTRYKRMMNKYR